jgi:hypothetical protein
MTDHDLGAFTQVFQLLRGTFALRGESAEIHQQIAVYFRILRRYPLSAVEAGAATWMEKGSRFPKPVDWIGAIPRRETIALLEMPPEEAREHLHAKSLHYEDAPCHCVLCKGAGVDHRFLRYVPDIDRDGRDARMRLGDTVVTRGHWAHGEELARWYDARDRYRALEAKYPPKTMPRVRKQLSAATRIAAFLELEIVESVARSEALAAAVDRADSLRSLIPPEDNA